VVLLLGMLLLLVTGLAVNAQAAPTRATSAPTALGSVLQPRFSTAVAFDQSRPARDIARESVRKAVPGALAAAGVEPLDIRPDRGPIPADRGYSGDGALQSAGAKSQLTSSLDFTNTLANFEGLSNLDNFNLFGFRVNPPDPVGDVGRNHYVEMINLAFAVYNKQGNLLMGPLAIGDLWEDFPVEDCTDPSGDPIVFYDQHVNRWILSQFTTRGLADPTLPFYDCVAISKTPDPTGVYYRYAFITQPDPDGGFFFPDYPKYGVWTNSYVMTTRDFGTVDGYGISVYALEKAKMISGNPNARAVQFFLDSDVVPIYLMGDGLLPADLDGTRRPHDGDPVPVVGTMDDDFPFYGAPFDALNVFELSVLWNSVPLASFELVDQIPVAEFDSVFPCGVVPGSAPPSARDCLPQPGITDGSQYLDILSYRQRPTWRLAYRNFGNYEAMVTNQSVEALPGVAGVRWYELRRTNGAYSLYQQGTYAPADGVHRWMGSIAMDKHGNMALGYSVVNGIDVFPGIRYTGRMAGDPLGQMTLGEGVVIDGSGVQTTTNSRWGDYTSMNIDPKDDCTFWYVNEYYEVSGLPLPLPPPPLPFPGTTAPWQTRIASFRVPGC
ncbi:MAG TPA: hypothetical protein VF434_08850, partial [Promineifilum sp.]